MAAHALSLHILINPRTILSSVDAARRQQQTTTTNTHNYIQATQTTRMYNETLFCEWWQRQRMNPINALENSPSSSIIIIIIRVFEIVFMVPAVPGSFASSADHFQKYKLFIYD